MAMEEWKRYSVVQWELDLGVLQRGHAVTSSLLQDAVQTRLYHYDHFLNPREVEMARMDRRFRRAILTRGHESRLDWPRHRRYWDGGNGFPPGPITPPPSSDEEDSSDISSCYSYPSIKASLFVFLSLVYAKKSVSNAFMVFGLSNGS